MRSIATIACALVLACSRPAPTPPKAEVPRPRKPASPLAADAVAGVRDRALAALLADHWEWRMRRSPVWATTLGDHRFDDRLGDVSRKAVAEDRAAARRFLERARQVARGAHRRAMTHQDIVTVRLLIERLEVAVASDVCELHLWSVSAQHNPIAGFNYLPEQHKVKTPADAANLLARYRAVAGSIDHHIANLRRGLKRGMVANAETVRRAIALVDGQLAKPIATWALMEPIAKRHPSWPAGVEARFDGDLGEAVKTSIAPAYRRYRDLLRDEVLPKARSGAKVGLIGLPHIAGCYQARIRNFIGFSHTPDHLHQLGRAEIAAINKEMSALGKKLFGTAELPAVLEKLRTDPALRFSSKAEIVAAAEKSLAAAKAAIPRWFGVLPRTDCVVVPIPDYEARYTTIAYYRQPHFDGSKPGEYFINTYAPTTRPRFEMQALTFHESIPGHHLQIAIAQERARLPAFRRLDGFTAFIEGWALYTERLADEMGLYSSDLDRMGMLSYDAWRAARLVVDTGIHAKGWTRKQAETYMLEHTALAKNNIVNEVDRYISWPGQALGYKVGQLEFLRLRARAKKLLGPRFDIRKFHDVVLKDGAVTLPLLAQRVELWLHAETGGASSTDPTGS